MDKISLNVIILLDDVSRGKLKTNIADLFIHNVRVVNDLREINSRLINKTNKVLVLESYLKNKHGFANLELYKETYNLEYYYLGTDEVYLNLMGKIAKTFSMDPTEIDYEKIYSIMYNDTIMQERYVKAATKELVEVATEKLKEEKGTELGLVLEDYLRLREYNSILERNLTASNEIISSLSNSLQLLQENKELLETDYLEVINRVKGLNQLLKQYEIILSKDVYEKVQLDRYPDKPGILYLKEYEELLDVDSFISTLYEVFRSQHRLSVKVVRLYDSSASKRILTIPPYYKVVKNKFTRSDIIANDFIVKVGQYKEMFDLILTNLSKLDLLIVVDCKDHNDLVLSGTFLTLAMCRNVKNLEIYNLNEYSTVVNNNKDSEMDWTYREEYDSMDPVTRFLHLSSKPVMQNILDLYRVYSQIGG